MKGTKEPNPDGSGRIPTVDKVETATRAGEKIYNDGTPEKASLSGLCYAGVDEHSFPILQYKDAIAGELETREILTHPRYSFGKSGQHDEAVEVLGLPGATQRMPT